MTAFGKRHRAQLANIAKQAKAALKAETLEAVADRGYFSSPEILECHEAGITVTLPKPLTSGAIVIVLTTFIRLQIVTSQLKAASLQA